VRNVNNIVQSDNFQIAFNLANEEEQRDILLAIGQSNKEKLKYFIMIKITGEGDDFEKLPIRKLHEIAAHIGIPYYKVKSKLIIIEEIRENVTERLEKNCERKCV
jgi:hypothetical protein